MATRARARHNLGLDARVHQFVCGVCVCVCVCDSTGTTSVGRAATNPSAHFSVLHAPTLPSAAYVPLEQLEHDVEGSLS